MTFIATTIEFKRFFLAHSSFPHGFFIHRYHAPLFVNLFAFRFRGVPFILPKSWSNCLDSFNNCFQLVHYSISRRRWLGINPHDVVIITFSSIFHLFLIENALKTNSEIFTGFNFLHFRKSFGFAWYLFIHLRKFLASLWSYHFSS